MHVHRRDAARRAAGFVDPKEILRCNDPGDWSNFCNLSAAPDNPPAGPSVKSQTLPADSATNPQGPRRPALALAQ